uniref:Myb-related protein 3R-1 n=1 Tax=Anthurium amnicola TaxID=1678845 RepID=A0A1D1XDW3_9ARAE
MMVVKELRGEPEGKGEVFEAVKKKEVDVEAKVLEEPARDPSSPVSDGSCQTTVAKPNPVPGRTSGPTRRSTKGGWTEEEDEVLARVVKQFKGKNWKKIAEFFPDRSDVQCLHRWQKVLDPALVKGAWTKEEDKHIIELVNKYGAKKWAVIASKMPGRIGKQCRERWHNHLNPAINKGAWTTEEEITLIRAHQTYGNKWAEIAKFLPGRADNSIKNHWNCSVKKKLDSYLSSESGLLCPAPKITALDLNSDPADMEYSKEFSTLKASMIIDEKPIPALAVNASPVRLLDGMSRMPKEDSDFYKTKAQPMSAEGLRFPKDVAIGRDMNDTSTVGRGSTYFPRRENINHVNAQDYTASFLSKDDYQHSTTSDALTPITPLQHKPNASIGNASYLLMKSHEPTTKELFASPERLERHVQLWNSLPATNTTSNLNEYTLSSLQGNMPMDLDKVVNHDQSPCTPVLVDKVKFDPDRCAPFQLRDLMENMTKAKFESNNSMLEPDIPVRCSAPPKLLVGTSSVLKDPESILRDAAKSFRNIPSILRKRHHKHLGPSPVKKPYKDLADAEDLYGGSNPLVKVGNVADASGLECLHQCETQTCNDNSPNGAQRVRKLFLSSSAPSKSDPSSSAPPIAEIHDAMRSVEKRLEFAFDMVDTPSVTFGVNNAMDISKNSQDELHNLGQSLCHLIPEGIATCD